MTLVAIIATIVVAGVLVWEIVTDCHDYDRAERDRAHRRLMDEIGRLP